MNYVISYQICGAGKLSSSSFPWFCFCHPHPRPLPGNHMFCNMCKHDSSQLFFLNIFGSVVAKIFFFSVVLLLVSSNRNFQGSYLYALSSTQHYHQGSSPLLVVCLSLFCLLIFHSKPLQLSSNAQAMITKFWQSLYSMFLFKAMKDLFN